MALSDPNCDGVANIWPSSGKAPVGMGIVVREREVLTCAHVVNLQHRDCAVLLLEEAIPEECGVAILADIDGHLLSDDELSVFAATHANTPGVQIDAKFDRRVGQGWAQLTCTTKSLSLVSGCSGAAVWDKDKQSVIGMAVAKVPTNEVPVAFSLPVSTLVGSLKDLPHERKTISRKSHLSWLLVSVILFFFMLAHFLPTQGGSNPNILPWTKDTRTLSAFFGLHFYIFLAPFPLWIWFRHTRSFARHHWKARVPPFLNLNPYMSNSNGPVGAGITLLFLGLLPAYAQGHFARIVFGTPATVGIRPSSFGLDPSDPRLTCFSKFCQHEDVGLWSILEWSPYFDNVYQIGGPKLRFN